MSSPTIGPGCVLSGRYRLEGHLGSGATSSVWRARDLDLGRTVAVKALLGTGVEPELAARFEREGTILGRLSHPNVVPVHATGVDGGRPYLVMELVEGVSLDRVLANGPLPVEDALALVADVAAGLAAAHRAGVVHRDVKPANILCGTDGVPRLVDFGIARAGDLTTMTRADRVLGTASYLSPEQARGDVPGPPGDVYALGCVLYETLTGRPPFTAATAVAVAYRHVHEAPVPVRSLRPDVPADVEAVVSRTLAKDPAGRYPTAAELEADLRGVAAGRPPASTAVETAAIPAVDATVADGTMVLPVVADAATGVTIDPSPLVVARPRRRRWALAAAVAAAVVMVGLLLGAVAGGDGRPAEAGDTRATTPSAPTTLVTAVPPTVAPTTAAPPPAPAASRGKGDDKGKGKGKGHGKGR